MIGICLDEAKLRNVAERAIVIYRLKNNAVPSTSFVLDKVVDHVKKTYNPEQLLEISSDKNLRTNLISAVSYAMRGAVSDENIESVLFSNDTNDTSLDVFGLQTLSIPFDPGLTLPMSIEQSYGSQNGAYINMTNMFNTLAVESIFINNGEPINPENVSTNIFLAKLGLVSNILDIIDDSKRYKKPDGTYYVVGSLKKEIKSSNNPVYRVSRDLARNKFSNFSIDINALNTFFNENVASTVTNNTLNKWAYGTQEEKKKLKAYNSLFILRNFDMLMKNKFPSIISMSKAYQTNDVSYFDYDVNFDENGYAKNWNDENDDISAFQRAGGVTKTIISALPLYNYTTKKKTNALLTSSRFNSAIGFIKDLASSPVSNIMVYDNPDKSLREIGGITIKQLISSINENPTEGFRRAFNIIVNGYGPKGRSFFDWMKSSPLVKSSSHADTIIDSIYSIYQSFYGDENGMLIGKSESRNAANPSLPNYYGILARYMAGLYKNKFIYYRRDYDSDNREIRSDILNDRGYLVAEKALKARIYNASEGIPNQIVMLSKSVMPKWANKSIVPSITNKINVNASPVSSVVRFKNIPIGDRIYSFDFDTTSPYIFSEKANEAPFLNINYMDANGEIHIVDNFKEVEKYIADNITPQYETYIDRLMSIMYQTPIDKNEDLRKLLYSNTGSLENVSESAISSYFRAGISIAALSSMNSYFVEHSRTRSDLDSLLKNSGIFPYISAGTPSVIPMRDKKGINNLSKYISTTISNMVGAISYMDNMTDRDTIKMSDGKTAAATQPMRLMNAIDLQFNRMRKLRDERIKLGMDINNIPAFGLPVVNTVKSFMDNLVKNEIITEEETKKFSLRSSDVDIMNGIYTTRIADINGVIKKRADFTTSESVTASYVIDFLNGMFGDSKASSGIVFDTQINSDKGIVQGTSFNKAFVKDLYSNPELALKIIRGSMGLYYTNVFNNIRSDYDKLDLAIDTIAVTPDVQNMQFLSTYERSVFNKIKPFLRIGMNLFSSGVYTNFSRFNNIAKNAGVDAYDTAMTLSKIYNFMLKDNYDGNRVETIDQSHFLKNGNRIAFNKLLLSKLIMFSPDKFGMSKKNSNDALTGGELKADISYFDIDSFKLAPEFFMGFNQFMVMKKGELAYSLIDSNVRISNIDANGNNLGFNGLNQLMASDPARTTNGNELVLCSIKHTLDDKDGKWKIGDVAAKISNKSDMYEFVNKLMGGNQTDIQNAMSSYKSLSAALRDRGYRMEPLKEISIFNMLDYFFGRSYEISTLGDDFNHPVKEKAYNDAKNCSVLDSLAINAETKRNVSHTTTIHPWVVNDLNGTPQNVFVAPVEDLKNMVSTFSGSEKIISPQDGIAYIAPDYYYILNNSAGDGKVGPDMKPYFHYYNAEKGTGSVIKCSVNSFTNQTMKFIKNYDSMARKMMGAIWKDANGNPIIGDIFNDFGFRRRVLVGEKRYSRLMMNISNKYGLMFRADKNTIYKIIDITYNPTIDNPYNYKRTLARVDENGVYDANNGFSYDNVTINSNYTLWKAFGGIQSVEKTKDGKLEYSENSIKALADMECLTAVMPDGSKVPFDFQAKSQKDVYQFMKHGNTVIVASHGSMKQGYTNVNRFQDFYYDKNGMLNSFEFDMLHSGIVLDPGHKSDNSTIADLTQVRNALSSQGYTIEQSNAIYKALSVITESDMRDLVEATGGTMDSPNYSDFAANIIVRSMAASNSFSDDAREACKDLINRVKKGGIVTYKELADKIDVSSDGFMLSSIPVLASYINKSSIVKKTAGSLALMKPSSGMVQIFGEKSWNDIGVTDAEKLEYLLDLNKKAPDIESPHATLMGHIYKVESNYDDLVAALGVNGIIKDKYKTILDNGDIVVNEEGVFFNLKSSRHYNALKDLCKYITQNTNNNPVIREAFVRKANQNEIEDLVGGYIALGRELAPIDYHFTVGVGNAQMDVNLYDTRACEIMLRLRESDLTKEELSSIDAELSNYLVKINPYYSMFPDIIQTKIDNMSTLDKARVFYQDQVNEISDSRKKSRRSVYLKGIDPNNPDEISEYTIIPKTVKVRYHEAIGPDINRQKFDIDNDVNIDSITPEYFMKKAIARLKIKAGPNEYSYALLKNGGNHIYIYSRDLMEKAGYGKSVNTSGLSTIKPTTITENGKTYVVNNRNEKMYEISDDDVIYRKSNGALIIETSNPSTIIQSLGFSGIRISSGLFGRNTELNNDMIRSIVYNVFNDSAAKFDKKGNLISGSESALYMINDHDGTMFIDDEIKRAAMEAESGNQEDTNMVIDNMLKKLKTEGVESFKSSSIIGERNLYKKVMSMYNSFRLSLNSLVARTPSQTMQSFMPMSFVLFDKSGSNSCFVNDMQIFLQGSDFDGDKTNFQEYAVDWTGNIIGWSNYFSTLDLENSMKLPLPDGVKSSGFREMYDDDSLLYNLLFSKLFKTNKNGEYKLIDNPNISDIADFINIIMQDRSNGNYEIRIPSIVDEYGDVSYIDKKNLSGLVDFVDEYNAYMRDINNCKSEGIKNFILSRSISVIEDPKNLYEAMSSVDDMSYISDIGKTDLKSAERLGMQSANFINKYMLRMDSIIGKDGIAVVASGMKSYFNCDNMYNSVDINNVYEARLGDDGISILGKRYNFAANWNPSKKTRKIILDELERVSKGKGLSSGMETYISDMIDVLSGYNMISNSALVLSALLTEATDNMKNLNLSKINADINTIPLYVFGIFIGMDIRDIGHILMSNTGRMAAERMRGNVFYGDNSSKNIGDVVKSMTDFKSLGYESLPKSVTRAIKDTPLFGKLMESKLVPKLDNGETIESDWARYIYNVIEKTQSSIEAKIRSYSNNIKSEEDYDYYESEYESTGNSRLADMNIGKFREFIRRVKDFVYTRDIINRDYVVNKVTGQTYRMADAIIALSDGALEFRTVSQIVGLNKGGKATKEKQMAFMNNIKSIFDRIKKNKRDLRDSILSNGESNPYIYGYQFDIYEFMNNPKYRRDTISLYDNNMMVAVNPLRIIDQLPLIKSYVNINNLIIGMSQNMSKKNKFVEWIADAASKYCNVKAEKSYQSIYRNSQMYVNQMLFRRFLEDNKDSIRISLPTGFQAYVKGFGKKTLTEPKQITPYSAHNAANFLKYMNEVVIPNMKNGVFDERNPNMTRAIPNKFVEALTSVSIDRTLNGNLINAYAITVDKRSNNPYDINLVEQLKLSSYGLNGLKYIDSEGNKHSISDLFYIYDMLVFNGVNSQYSMMDYIPNDAQIRKLYNQFESNIFNTRSVGDIAQNIIPFDYINYNYPGIVKYLAPIESTNVSKSQFVRYYNRDTMHAEFYTRKPKADNSSDQSTSYQDDEDYYYDSLYGFVEDESYPIDEGRYYNESYNTKDYTMNMGMETIFKPYDVFVDVGSSSRDVVSSSNRYDRRAYEKKMKKVILTVDNDFIIKNRIEDIDFALTGYNGDINENADDIRNMMKITNDLIGASDSGVVAFTPIYGNENSRIYAFSENEKSNIFIGDDRSELKVSRVTVDNDTVNIEKLNPMISKSIIESMIDNNNPEDIIPYVNSLIEAEEGNNFCDI